MPSQGHSRISDGDGLSSLQGEALDISSRLNKRQKECLSLVAELKGSKEIARQLGISPHTVDSYLREAVAALGARDRREAATMYLQSVSRLTPQSSGGEFSWVEADAEPTATMLVHHPGVSRSGAFRLIGIPLRQGNEPRNLLTSVQRLTWILIGALAFALMFAASINILDALTRIARNTVR